MLTRQQRRRYYAKRKTVLFSAVMGVVLLAVICIVGRSLIAVPVAASSGVVASQNANMLWPNWANILFSGIPGSSAVKQPQVMTVKNEVTPQHILRGIVMFVTSVDIKDMRSLFHAEIPLIAALKTSVPTVSAMSLPNFPKFDPASLIPSGKPIVGVYHTHTAECFVPTSGVSHKPGGQYGDIVGVGDTLVKRLEKHGIPAMQSKAIHDYPSFMKAYGVSEETVKKMLSEHPSLQMMFDIHRDADKWDNSTAVVNGVNVARISIIVATGQQDLSQPHWQENHAFAKLIDAKLNQHYPGVSKGIQLVEWRYNQHLHPRALLIEVGCHENSKEEADRSIEMFGDVLAEIIAENNNR